MKKIVCALLSLLMIGGIVLAALPVSALEKSAGLTEQEIIRIVGALEIMIGDENGNLHLDNPVTRAEFVKMVICASGGKDEADVKVAYAPFPDVPASFWGAGFIKSAVSRGLINGYLDGTFRPNGNVKLEEAVNIVLKVLGYTDADYIGSYPDGQLAKMKALKLNDSIGAARGEELTRRECMYLLYNALCTKNKNGMPCAQMLGYAVDADGNIDYHALVEDDKEGPAVLTDPALLPSLVGFSPDDAVIYKNGKLSAAASLGANDVIYYAPTYRTLWAYDTRTAGIVEECLPDETDPKTLTIGGVAYPIADSPLYSELRLGKHKKGEAVIALIGENNELVSLIPAKLLTTDKDGNLSGGSLPENVTLYQNEVKSDKAPEPYSVVYYAETASLAFAYDNSVSGLVDAILPNKQEPASLSVGGRSYPLSSNVKDLFKNEASYRVNDFITLYLGKNGMVDAVCPADIYDTDIYEDNGLDYTSLVNKTIRGPIIASGNNWQDKLGFSADDAVYYRNNVTVGKNSIRDYNVLYYSNAFRSVWIYGDKATGRLEAVMPNTVSPASVTVAGVNYPLETSDMSIAFSGSGSFKVGDNVTLLLGKDGGVAGVVTPTNASAEVYGLVTETGRKDYLDYKGDTYESDYVKVSGFDGTDYTVAVSESKDFDNGDLVRVSFDGTSETVRPYSYKYNDMADVVSAVKDGKIAPDAILVDYDGTTFVNVYPARLKAIASSITSRNVSYFRFDDDGSLSYLVLHNATGDTRSYGAVFSTVTGYRFVTTAKNNDISAFSVPVVGAVSVTYQNGEAFTISNLSEHDASSALEGAVICGGSTYELWDKVVCLVMTQKDYTVAAGSSLNDVVSVSDLGKVKSLFENGTHGLRAYCDGNGLVRVLVAYKKH